MVETMKGGCKNEGSSRLWRDLFDGIFLFNNDILNKNVI